jgi:hypothetical protein
MRKRRRPRKIMSVFIHRATRIQESLGEVEAVAAVAVEVAAADADAVVVGGVVVLATILTQQRPLLREKEIGFL